MLYKIFRFMMGLPFAILSLPLLFLFVVIASIINFEEHELYFDIALYFFLDILGVM